MPVKNCSDNGKPGYKWGDAGKCYTYNPKDENSRKEAKRKAYVQGAAIGKQQKEKEEGMEDKISIMNKVVDWLIGTGHENGNDVEISSTSTTGITEVTSTGSTSGYIYIDPSTFIRKEEKIEPAKKEVSTSAESSESSFARTVAIKSLDEREWIIYGVVMEPTAKGAVTGGKFKGEISSVDTDEEFTTEEEIRKAMIGFMEQIALMKVDPHNLMHKDVTLQTAIIENFIAPTDMEIGGEKVLKGSWIQGTKVYDEDIRQAILAGEITGYSVEGSMRLAPVE